MPELDQKVCKIIKCGSLLLELGRSMGSSDTAAAGNMLLDIPRLTWEDDAKWAATVEWADKEIARCRRLRAAATRQLGKLLAILGVE